MTGQVLMDHVKIHLTQSIVARPAKLFQPSNFQHLDSLRGLLCLNVVLVHAEQLLPIQSKLLKQYFDKTEIFAVPGFFLLSAFLLTYRLLLELFNYKLTEFKPIFKLLAKYAIRRFFRIYPLFFIFIVFIKCLIFASPQDAKFYVGINRTPLLKMVLIDQTMGGSHLWTIPVEINYYFIIPVVCLIMFSCCKRAFLALTLGAGSFLSWNFYKAHYNQRWKFILVQFNFDLIFVHLCFLFI